MASRALDIADLDHVLDVWMPGEVQFFFHRLWQTMPVEIVQMHVERFQAPQHGETATVHTCLPSTS